MYAFIIFFQTFIPPVKIGHKNVKIGLIFLFKILIQHLIHHQR